MSQPKPEDPYKWIREPTESLHGLRIVNHDGTAFIEQIDNDGKEWQSIMITEREGLLDAVEWFREQSKP